MGTQLAFGGSGAAPWDGAADDTVALDAEAIGGSADGSGPGTDTSTIDSLIDHVIQAIEAHERRPIPGASTTYTPTAVRPSGYSAGSTTIRSGTSKFVSTPRAGRGPKQSVARGAAVAAAGSALARGDADALAELGLDLEALRALSAREQQQQILDGILGAPGHPDDEALRRAGHAMLKEIAADPTLNQDDQIDYLLGAYVYEQALVELTSQHARKDLTREAVQKLDKRFKPYIFKKAKHAVTGGSKYLSPKQFIAKATSLVEIVFAALRSK